MRVVFPYEKRESGLYGSVKRPIAYVSFWSKNMNIWLEYPMIVDTGADLTTLPIHRSFELGIHVNTDCTKKKIEGVGGETTIYQCKNNVRVKIGNSLFSIPFGFLHSTTIPPLLGREGCLNLFQVLFANFQTEIRS